MKKRNSSKSGTKRNRGKSDYVVDNPISSQRGMLDQIHLSPRIHRSDKQLMAKVNSASSLPVELHSETISYIPLEAEESVNWKTDHQLINEIPLVVTDVQAPSAYTTLEMTAIAHADALLEMLPCNDSYDSKKAVPDPKEPYRIETSHLTDEAVCAEKLADFSVISSKIAPESIQSDHISNLSINSQHLADESIRSYHLYQGAVERDAIAYGAIDSSRLALDSVSTVHIQEEAVQTAHLEDGAVTADKLAGDSIGSEHVRAGSIFAKHLGFTPVRVMSERSPALQFGTTSFTFEDHNQRELEINVLFTNSYEKADYTFVCTPNLYGTCAVIQEQYYDGVVVRVMREIKKVDDSKAPISLSGALSWIAVG